jgi:hypothetical protein
VSRQLAAQSLESRTVAAKGRQVDRRRTQSIATGEAHPVAHLLLHKQALSVGRPPQTQGLSVVEQRDTSSRFQILRGRDPGRSHRILNLNVGDLLAVGAQSGNRPVRVSEQSPTWDQSCVRAHLRGTKDHQADDDRSETRPIVKASRWQAVRPAQRAIPA